MPHSFVPERTENADDIQLEAEEMQMVTSKASMLLSGKHFPNRTYDKPEQIYGILEMMPIIQSNIITQERMRKMQ